MLKTDAWAYLDIRNPLCAWNTYRGIIGAPPEDAGAISVWAAAVLRRAVNGNVSAVAREVALERVRTTQFPHRTSRLRGLYCFLDEGSAEKALSWDSGRSHFRREFIAELSLVGAGQVRDRLDSNWLTYSPLDEDGFFAELSWIPNYWSGAPMPNKSPVWETIIDGDLVILGTDLRERAYEVLRKRFPDGLLLLETARIAAWAGSSLGNCCGWLLGGKDGTDVKIDYYMNMRDANDESILSRMQQLIKEGHPIRSEDIASQIARGNLGATPDFRPLGFSIPRSLIQV